jgi:predicted DNA-binding protein YlxM (UPF0122 family)
VNELINLLNNGERRKLQFAEILTNTDKWLTLTELGEELDCSVRVLKEDMVFFRKNFSDFQIKTSSQGLQLTFKQDKGLEALYQKLLSESTAYHLLEIIFMFEDKTISDLAEELYVSVSTLYRLIEQINAKTAVYDFKIETNPCRVTGKEENIRYFYYNYFNEKYSYLDWWYKTIDEETLDKFLDFFIEFTQIPADFAFYNIFKLVTIVNLIRYKNKHLVETNGITINFDEIIPELGAYAKAFEEFEEKLDVKMSKELIHQIFTPYVQEGFSLNKERLFKKAAENKALAKTIELLSQELTKISEESAIPLYNKDEIIFALNNVAHLEYQEPQSGYILYNRNKYFAEEIKNNFPHFHSLLYEGMKKYRTFIKKPMTEDGINFFIYITFIFWENLVPELGKKFKKIRVLIISDRHVLHGHMLKDFIEHEFNEQIVIDIYTSNNLDKKIIEALDYNLIVTNFPISSLENKRTVYIESVPTFYDLRKLKNALDAIISERLNA